MKLNIGCGYKKIEGYIGVDIDPDARPDVLHDLTIFPWPFENDTVEEILLINILEHLCPDPKEYLKVWKEIYRICKPNAEIKIEVTHWRNDNFYHDPTHVRPITPVGIAMMDQTRNQRDIVNNGSETKLGLQLKVDFDLVGVRYVVDSTTGIVGECHYLAKVIKPARITSTSWRNKINETAKPL